MQALVQGKVSLRLTHSKLFMTFVVLFQCFCPEAVCHTRLETSASFEQRKPLVE